MNLSAPILAFHADVLSFNNLHLQRIPPSLRDAYGKQAKYVDLSFNALRSIEELKHFTVLEVLTLDNNELDDKTQFVRNTRLQELSLNKNKFADLYRLMNQLSSCYPNLQYLSLLDNPAYLNKDKDDYQKYRYYVIHKFPKLKFLDSTRVTTQERIKAKKISAFVSVFGLNRNIVYMNKLTPKNSGIQSKKLQLSSFQ
ncbi:leucine-rich melanocyte differentiation-associated protein-like [Limulus polyphemus]|uniref:Leucine-rich melanocyte differentiation-associated protein-like n=1 Tax=Limulus polyphemus TaxID=6850 RepID=A0ABM1THC9_LIMPO|nr:leucine-rich melanocyte differentiation-associated protein-like [Limulus polyphemus]